MQVPRVNEPQQWQFEQSSGYFVDMSTSINVILNESFNRGVFQCTIPASGIPGEKHSRVYDMKNMTQTNSTTRIVRRIRSEDVRNVCRVVVLQKLRKSRARPRV